MRPISPIPLPHVGFTKHYYAGVERLCTKLGNGGLGDEYIGVDPELTDRANQLFDQVMADSSTRSLGNNDFVIADIEGSESGFNVAFDPSQAPQHVNSDITIDLDPFFATMESLSASDGSREDELYFFHSDHLGSGSWITNGTGAPVQHLQYLAYGDKFVDHKASASSYSERFTFTGKERDAETGFTYHGARYFDAALLTSWMAVDPMSDKYPSLSPYNYCMWNPVKLVDENGEWPWEPKHIREARRYARKNDGHLTVFEERNGVKMASVGVCKKDNSGQIDFSITLFRPKGYHPRGEIKEMDRLTTFESYLDEPSSSLLGAFGKALLSTGYEIINSPNKYIAGRSIGGTSASSEEKFQGFIDLVSGMSGKAITGVTGAKRGLDNLNRVKGARQAAIGAANDLINSELVGDYDKIDAITNSANVFVGYVRETKKYSDHITVSD